MMGFSSKQVAALRRNVDHRHIRVRQSNTGRELSYLEGWYVISQANRIFGFDGWSRETLESKCVLARENRGYFTAVYTAKVRLTVQANGATIVREGHGTGEGRGEFPGEVHDTALKAAETDATKRALATFGKPFGLELYRGSQAARQGQAPAEVRRATPLHSAAQAKPPAGARAPAATNPAQAAHELGRPAEAAARGGEAGRSADTASSASRSLIPAAAADTDESGVSPLPVEPAPALAPVAKYARDDTTPIPRPSTYYGREHYHDVREENAHLIRRAAREAARQPPSALELPEARPSAAQPRPAASQTAIEDPPSILPSQEPAGRIDKSVLPLGEPKRIRDKEHLKFVARQPCLICGRQPADAHHLRFAQPRAMDMKVSDEFTVPLCRTHHRYLHQTGNELAWWEKARIEPLPIARKLWETSHPRVARMTMSSSSTGVAQAQTVASDETKPIAVQS
jgi:Rad52/22 family double-strand break repair protein